MLNQVVLVGRLVYDLQVNKNEKGKKICNITMTFTTPTCPMADMIMDLVKNAVLDIYACAIPRRENKD